MEKSGQHHPEPKILTRIEREGRSGEVPLLDMDKEDPGSLLGKVVEADELVGREGLLAVTGLKLHDVAVVEAHPGL